MTTMVASRKVGTSESPACPTSPASCRRSSRAIRTAAEQLLPLVYDELRKLAAAKLAQEKPGQTLQATALVHEAYLRLVGCRDRRHQQPGDQPRPFLCRRRRGDAADPGRAARAARKRDKRRRRSAARRAADAGCCRLETRPTICSRSTKRLSRLAAEDPTHGRAGQAAIFCRTDHRSRPPRPWAFPSQLPIDIGLTPGPGCMQLDWQTGRAAAKNSQFSEMFASGCDSSHCTWSDRTSVAE